MTRPSWVDLTSWTTRAVLQARNLGLLDPRSPEGHFFQKTGRTVGVEQ